MDLYQQQEEDKKRQQEETRLKLLREEDEWTQRRHFHGDKFLAHRAEADKLFHQVAMAGIGLELTLITAFKVHNGISMLLHSATILAFIAVIPLYRKILDLRLRTIKRASQDFMGQEPEEGRDFVTLSNWYRGIFYFALALLLLSAWWSIWTNGSSTPLERLSDPL